MTRYSLTLVLTASLFLLVMSASAQNQEKQGDKPAIATAAPAEGPFAKFQQFSAILNGGMGRDTNRQIYRSGKLMRFDFPDHHRIADLETKSIWMVYPQKCSKFPMLDPGVFPFSRKFRVESSTTAGKETVDGHVCKVEDMVLVSEGPMSPTFKMKLYEAEDLNGFPVKIDVENPLNKAKFNISYSNVSLEPPNPKLFEPPAKCDVSQAMQTGPGKAKPKPAKPAAKPAPKLQQ